MTTNQIIEELNQFTINDSNDDLQLERVHEMTDMLRSNTDGIHALESLIILLERHPNVEFGTPGEPVHFIENFPGHYEELLLISLQRQPSLMTLWMLNRLINSKEGGEKIRLMQLLNNLIDHPNATAEVIQEAKYFYKYQRT